MANVRQGILSIPLPEGAGRSEIQKHAALLKAGLDNPLKLVKYLRRAVGDDGFTNLAFAYLMTYANDDRHYHIGTHTVDRMLSLFAEFLTPDTLIENPVRNLFEVKKSFYMAVHGRLHAPGIGIDADYADVYTAHVGAGQDNRHIEMRECDGQIPMFLTAFPVADPPNWDQWDKAFKKLSESAWKAPNSQYKKAFYRFLYTVLISISKIGQITEEKLESMSEQIKSDCGISMGLSQELVSQLFSVLCKAGRDWGVPLQVSLRQGMEMLDQHTMMRMFLTVTQSADSGVSGVNIVADAMTQFPRAQVWVFLMQECPTELARAIDAIEAVVADPYIVFGSYAERQRVRATQFGNVYYASQQLLDKVGGAKNVSKVKSASTASRRVLIDHLIQREVDETIRKVETADYEFGSEENIFKVRGGLGDLLTRFKNTV